MGNEGTNPVVKMSHFHNTEWQIREYANGDYDAIAPDGLSIMGSYSDVLEWLFRCGDCAVSEHAAYELDRLPQEAA